MLSLSFRGSSAIRSRNLPYDLSPPALSLDPAFPLVLGHVATAALRRSPLPHVLVMLVYSPEELVHPAATALIGAVVRDPVRLGEYILVVEVRCEVADFSVLGNGGRGVYTEAHPLDGGPGVPGAGCPVGEVQRVMEAAESHAAVENAELGVVDAGIPVVDFFIGIVVLRLMDSA